MDKFAINSGDARRREFSQECRRMVSKGYYSKRRSDDYALRDNTLSALVHFHSILQRRGGKGVTVALKDERMRYTSFFRQKITMIFCSSRIPVIPLAGIWIPEAQRTAKGNPIINFLGLAKDESIAAILDATENTGKHFALISKKQSSSVLTWKIQQISVHPDLLL